MRPQHALTRFQLRGVLLPSTTHSLATISTVLRDDVVSDDPRGERDVDQRKLLPQEVRALHLLAEGPQRLVELLEILALLLRVLRLHQAHEPGDDLLGDVIGPEADDGAVKWVGREDVRLVGGEGVLEEFADDEGLVESAAFVFDSGDEALRVDGCETLYGG